MPQLQSYLIHLHQFEWIGILIARCSLGLLFTITGASKLFLTKNRKELLSTLRSAHIPFPEFSTICVSTVEFLFGLCLFFGAFTPLACLMLGGDMLVAITTVSIKSIRASSPIQWLGEFLYLPEVLYLIILISLFFSGPGWISFDYILKNIFLF